MPIYWQIWSALDLIPSLLSTQDSITSSRRAISRVPLILTTKMRLRGCWCTIWKSCVVWCKKTPSSCSIANLAKKERRLSGKACVTSIEQSIWRIRITPRMVWGFFSQRCTYLRRASADSIKNTLIFALASISARLETRWSVPVSAPCSTERETTLLMRVSFLSKSPPLTVQEPIFRDHMQIKMQALGLQLLAPVNQKKPLKNSRYARCPSKAKCLGLEPDLTAVNSAISLTSDHSLTRSYCRLRTTLSCLPSVPAFFESQGKRKVIASSIN